MKKIVIGVVLAMGLLFSTWSIQEAQANGSGEPPLCFPGQTQCPVK